MIFCGEEFELIREDHEIYKGTLVRYHGGGGNVAVPEDVTCIQKAAFMGCKELKGVFIPEGVKRIESTAFMGCSNLRSIYISDSVSKFGNRCFGGCTAIKNLRLPDGLVKNISFFLIDLDTYPEFLFVNTEAFSVLRWRFMEAALRGFLYRESHGEGGSALKEFLRRELSENGVRLAGRFDGYLPFYEFLIAIPEITDEQLRALLDRTNSLECRALILERLHARFRGED